MKHVPEAEVLQRSRRLAENASLSDELNETYSEVLNFGLRYKLRVACQSAPDGEHLISTNVRRAMLRPKAHVSSCKRL